MRGSMRASTFAAIAFSAAVLGLSGSAQAQVAGAKLFFEGDMVRGAQAGAPGPFCVLDNQFKHLEKVVWRLRILDENGKPLDDKGLKSVVIELPDGQKMDARFGPHPGGTQPATDHFWTAIWTIPANFPNGTLVYKAVATDLQGKSATWEPFKRVTSQLQVVAGEIEIKKP